MSGPRLTEVALFTADVDGVAGFYERVLGIEPAERSEHHAVFPLGELVLRIHVTVDPAPVDGPRNLPWGRSAYVRDPDGRLVELT